MADNPSEKKISETSGVKAVLDEAAERIEATWREKLLRETADLRTENALLMAQVDEFSRKLAEARGCGRFPGPPRRIQASCGTPSGSATRGTSLFAPHDSTRDRPRAWP